MRDLYKCALRKGHVSTDPKFKPPFAKIDKGIRRAVKILWENGVETTESCEGGQGHPFPEPTVRFCGGAPEGFRALSIALQHGLKVSELRRSWSVTEFGEPNGPLWELTFSK
jgi:hypothetical protein